MRKLHAHKQYIVALLLSGFSSVFVCDFLCDVGVISWARFNSHAVITDHPKEAHHHHDSPTDHHHDDTHDHNKSHEQDDCCQDVVNQIYASLIKFELKQSTLQAPLYCYMYEAYTVYGKPNTYSQRLLSFLYTNLPPPVGGFHIRVLIQSFLH